MCGSNLMSGGMGCISVLSLQCERPISPDGEGCQRGQDAHTTNIGKLVNVGCFCLYVYL